LSRLLSTSVGVGVESLVVVLLKVALLLAGVRLPRHFAYTWHKFWREMTDPRQTTDAPRTDDAAEVLTRGWYLAGDINSTSVGPPIWIRIRDVAMASMGTSSYYYYYYYRR
jgi:hypothetical protein